MLKADRIEWATKQNGFGLALLLTREGMEAVEFDAQRYTVATACSPLQRHPRGCRYTDPPDVRSVKKVLSAIKVEGCNGVTVQDGKWNTD